MAVPKISVELREASGSTESRKTREDGMVPSVIYGRGEPTRTIKVNVKALDKIISEFGSSSMVTMTLDGETLQSYIQEVQRDPVSKNIIHVDFLNLIAGQKVRIKIPVIVHNTEALIKDMILVGQDITELDVSCFPKDIVQSIDIDASTMEVYDTVTVGDLNLPEEIEVLHDADDRVMQLYYNRVEEEEDDDVEEITEPIFDTGADEEVQEDDEKEQN